MPGCNIPLKMNALLIMISFQNIKFSNLTIRVKINY